MVVHVNIKELKKDYNSGMPKQEIITKHHITIGQLNYQIVKNKWKRRKRKGKKGNKGGHGTIGNKNALVTGAYSNLEGCFDKEELEYLKQPLKTKKEELEKEIKYLEIREMRMFKEIKQLKDKGKDLTVVRLSKYITTSIEAEHTLFLIERLEKALTKIQEAKRRAIDSLHKIEIENEKFSYVQSKNNDNPQSATDRVVIINDLPNPDDEEVEENEPSTD